jgi:hypothetical protein
MSSALVLVNGAILIDKSADFTRREAHRPSARSTRDPSWMLPNGGDTPRMASPHPLTNTCSTKASTRTMTPIGSKIGTTGGDSLYATKAQIISAIDPNLSTPDTG